MGQVHPSAFMLPKVQYLGHIISAEGLHPAEDKIRVITQTPAPQNLAQLRSFLGMVNYYGKFLHQLSSRVAPLYSLLHAERNQMALERGARESIPRSKEIINISESASTL